MNEVNKRPTLDDYLNAFLYLVIAALLVAVWIIPGLIKWASNQ